VAQTFGRLCVAFTLGSPRPNVGAAQPWEAKKAAHCYPVFQPLRSRPRMAHPIRMAKRRIFDVEHHAQFVTFSCYRRRRLLDDPRVRDDFVKITSKKLRDHQGICCGFVVMPQHVHAIVWFDATGALSPFMKKLEANDESAFEARAARCCAELR
jgi:hypothetical protein